MTTLLTLFAYGFRPFFLLAALHAAIALPAGMLSLHGANWLATSLPPLIWHVHEMLYGFVMAAVAGFLLTAVPSWTKQRAIVGAPLVVLAAIWLVGRVVVSVPLGLSPVLIACVDLLFPIAVAVAITPSLVRSNNLRNGVFVVFLALLFVANLHFHALGGASIEPLYLTMNTVLVMLTLVGGRIVPAFTAAPLKRRGIDVRLSNDTVVDTSALAAVVVVLMVDIVSPRSSSSGIAAAIAALLLALRLARWHGHRTLNEPILWVLHLAYAWLPAGLALKAAWLLFAVPFASGWTHALTIGAFATMILAVMTRASLGHTGRALIANRSIVLAYLLVTGAALIRVFGPVVFPLERTASVIAAAVLWTSAFALFLVTYGPMLCRPRVDGRPG